jgi:hypothetical protein
MFVIKATLKDETRRLVFDGSRFPAYTEVQSKVSTTSVVITPQASRRPFVPVAAFHVLSPGVKLC